MDSVYQTKQDCCGCNACQNICPVNAINMTEDEEGFYYPAIDTGTCIDCGICAEVCPIRSAGNMSAPIRTFALKHVDNEVRRVSSSGGAFSAIAEYVIENHGVVYGCVYDSHIVARHMRAETSEQYAAMRGSKYVQSCMDDIYRELAEDLANDRFVLFTGTPCQVAAVQNYLNIKKIDATRLLAVDVICHGVSSPGVFKEHIDYLARKEKSPVIAYYNRYKVKAKTNVQLVVYKNKRHDSKSSMSQSYNYIFMSDYALRPACYTCKYAGKLRPSDITISDFHGLDAINEKFYDELGVSGVLVNTEKGLCFMQQIKNILTWECNYGDLAKRQPRLNNQIEICFEERERFWASYRKFGWDYILKSYGRCNISDTIKNYLLDKRRPYNRFVERIYAWKQKLRKGRS